MKTISRPTFPTSAPRGKKKVGEGRERVARRRKADGPAKANVRKGRSKISTLEPTVAFLCFCHSGSMIA